MEAKPDIKSLGPTGLSELCADEGFPRFRVRQLRQWLFQKGATSFEEMTNLPKDMRRLLESRFSISTPGLLAKQVSMDGTRKYLFSLGDGADVESVGIPSHDGRHLTVCFSTQAGCAMGCVFCATGLSGFRRNLSTSEMFDQVRLVGSDFGVRVSNAVAMGQGEPFANYGSVLGALRLMNDADFLGIGARHITVSTCGLVEGIERFSHEPEQFTLAVSLHSAIQETRDQIMPGVRSFPLDELRAALDRYSSVAGRRPTLEYALIRDVNDDDRHLDALVDFCTGLLCHVNLIPLNPVKGASSHQSTLAPSPNIEHFRSALMGHGIETSIRASRGADIDGACGQLRQNFSQRETES